MTDTSRREQSEPLTYLLAEEGIERLQTQTILRRDAWVAPWSSLVAIQPAGSKPPFFCVHAAAGDVFPYSDLACYLGPDQPLYGLQAQGLDGNHPPYTRVEDMARHYVEEICTFQQEGPYFLGGLSFGGLVAYEIAQQLLAQGHEVALLVLFDTYGPGYPNISYLRAIREKVAHLGHRIHQNVGQFTQLQAEKKGSFALEKVRNVTARSQRKNQKRLERVRKARDIMAYKLYWSLGRPLPPTLRYLHVRAAGYQASSIYAPQAYPGRITLFRASRQPAGCDADPTLGWGELALGGLDIHDIPGAHSHTLIREPKIQIVIDKLKTCLSEAQATVSRKQL